MSQPFSDLPSHPSLSDNKQTQPSSRRTLFIIIGILIGVSCICIAVAGVVIGSIFFTASNAESEITPVLDRFMQAMDKRDAAGAYQLFSSRSQQQTPIDDINELLDDTNYPLFEGYQSLSIDNTNISSRVTTNADEPQGTVATVSGQIVYQDGTVGNFQSVLEKEDTEWRIFGFHVTVPPEKFK